MNLQLSLKAQWFGLTDTNGKTEDYRELNHYWFTRLVFQSGIVIKYLQLDLDNKEYFAIQLNHLCKKDLYKNMIAFRLFTTNTMTLGYPSKTDTERIKIFEHAGIEIGYGRQKWGAEPNKLYFIIKHGKRLQ